MVALKEVLLFRYYYLLAAVGRVTWLARLAMFSGGTIASVYFSRLLVKTLRYTLWEDVSMFLTSQQRTWHRDKKTRRTPNASSRP